MTELLLFNVTNGLIIGAFYVLMALGLSLILNLSGVINFAHGGFLALGGYVAYSMMPFIGFWGALLLAPIAVALLGLVIERTMIRRLYGRDPLYSLLLTFGLAYIFQDFCRYVWGANGLPFSVPDFLSAPVSDELFFITWYRLFMVAVVTIAVGGLFLFLRYTRTGVRIRAGTLDLETVSVLGVNVRALRAFNFALGIFLAGTCRRFGERAAQPRAQHGRFAADAELRRDHRRRRRQPAGHAVGRAADRPRLRPRDRVLAVGGGCGDLRDHGDRAAAAPARTARRGRDADLMAPPRVHAWSNLR